MTAFSLTPPRGGDGEAAASAAGSSSAGATSDSSAGPGAFASTSANEKSQASAKKKEQAASDGALGVSLAPATSTYTSSSPPPPSPLSAKNKALIDKNKSRPGPSMAPAIGPPDADEDQPSKRTPPRRSTNAEEEEDSTIVVSEDDPEQRAGAQRIDGPRLSSATRGSHSLQNQRQEGTSGSGLIELEAELVEEGRAKEPPPVLADATPAVEPSKLRKYGPYGIILVLIAVVGALVAVFVPGGGSSSGSSEMELSGTATDGPSTDPTAPPTSVHFAEMLAFAQNKSSTSSLSDPSSPQYKAVEWLAQDKFDTGSDWGDDELLQRYVLRVLYHSTGGENWGGAQNDAETTWFQSSSVCDWGSTIAHCSNNGTQLDFIDLEFDNLQGTIPDELGLLTALTVLSLCNNGGLVGTIPTQLGLLTALKELYLWTNQLTGTVPTQLSKLTALEQMDVDENQLTGTIPVELRQLTALRELWLSNNKLTSTILPQLGQLGALTFLNFQNNELTGTIPPTLTQLTNLEELYFHNNYLTGQVPSGFCSAPFPDWRADGLYGNLLAADCMSEVECECCDACVDESGKEFCWNGSEFTTNDNEC